MGRLEAGRSFRRPCIVWKRKGMKRDAKDLAEAEQTGFDPWLIMRRARERWGWWEWGVLRRQGKTRRSGWFGGKVINVVMMNLNFHQQSWSCGQEAQKRGHNLPVIGRNMGNDAASVYWCAGGKPRNLVSDCFVSVSRKQGHLLRLRGAVNVSYWSLRVDTIWNSCTGEHEKTQFLGNMKRVSSQGTK